MSDYVYAAARKSLALRISFRLEGGFDLSERQTIDYIGLGQPPFARDPNAEPQILQSFGAMCVRIDHTLNAFFFGHRPAAPVEIEPLRRRIQFNPCPGRSCGVKHRRNVDGISLAL